MTDLEHVRRLVRAEISALTDVSDWRLDDDLVALGLDSLDVATLATRLYARTGVNLGVADVFQHRSAAALAEVTHRWLTRDGAAGSTPGPVVDGGLSDGQVRLWLDDNVRPGHALGNILCVAFRMTGPVAPAALERALRTVVDRHDALRTAVHGDDDGLPTARPLGTDAAVTVRHVRPDAGDLAQRAQRLAAELAGEVSLGRGPLVTAAIEESGAGVLLVLAVHHAAFDGDSVAILAREVSAELSGRPRTDPAATYASFAHEQTERHRSAELAERARQWAERFRDVADLSWPGTAPAPGGAPYGAVPFSVPAAGAAGLERHARARRVTPFVLGLTALARALSAVTGGGAFAVGVPHSARDDRRFDDTIGFFVATLPVPVRVDAADTDDVLIGRLSETVMDAMRHGDIPLPIILRRLRRRGTGRSPLFQAQFSWPNWVEPAWPVPGVSVEEIRLRPLVSQFELTVELFPRRPDEPLRGVVEYDPRSLTEQTAARVATAFTGELDALGRPGAGERTAPRSGSMGR